MLDKKLVKQAVEAYRRLKSNPPQTKEQFNYMIASMGFGTIK